MQYLVIAYDGTDAGAPARRQAARAAHLEGARAMKAAGTFLEGGAILDDSEQMIGSMMLVDFPGETELQEWLKTDPYVTGDVWRSIEVRPFRRAPI